MNLFDKFETGSLVLPSGQVDFAAVAWSPHPTFEGVALKHLITAENTGGAFSYHLVRLGPGKKIGLHIHHPQLETHEVVAGGGVCVNAGQELPYEPGTISIFPAGIKHEVMAGPDGLCLFAKFIPALC
ncbi:cupin domain-containing protein [Propionispora vibrioides]|uniref:Cupin domain-containing protein n=1 Tax=Propionispora vibrioides TaxID=112903 RepID=A0A1H8XW60_9FIRM|nr:cupin domain-containing protein [Propionispora vibrioides]SEP44290.1 Cupin domain-containing protein [Propionispora vibrioides]